MDEMDELEYVGFWARFGATIIDVILELLITIPIEREGIRLLAQEPCPDDGRTRRSRETNARGEYACAVTRVSVIGQPSSLNHELTYRAAKPPTTQQSRDGPAQRVEG